jgi:hypothetical protein
MASRSSIIECAFSRVITDCGEIEERLFVPGCLSLLHDVPIFSANLTSPVASEIHERAGRAGLVGTAFRCRSVLNLRWVRSDIQLEKKTPRSKERGAVLT